jgi:hypothetical protein
MKPVPYSKIHFVLAAPKGSSKVFVLAEMPLNVHAKPAWQEHLQMQLPVLGAWLAQLVSTVPVARCA